MGESPACSASTQAINELPPVTETPSADGPAQGAYPTRVQHLREESRSMAMTVAGRRSPSGVAISAGRRPISGTVIPAALVSGSDGSSGKCSDRTADEGAFPAISGACNGSPDSGSNSGSGSSAPTCRAAAYEQSR